MLSRRRFLLLPAAISSVVAASTNNYKPNGNWYDDLERFAKEYNAFVLKLKDNVFDAGSWFKVCKLFHKLEQ